MTRKSGTNGPAPLELRQFRLRKIAHDLDCGISLSARDREFLILALYRIGEGADANQALGVKARRGERKSAAQADRTTRMKMTLIWIAAVTKPTPDGDPPQFDLDSAFRAAEDFSGLAEDSLRQYWKEHPELHAGTMSKPISDWYRLSERKRGGK